MEDLLKDYMKTCIRYQTEEIPIHPFMKKPYFERNLLELYLNYPSTTLEEKINLVLFEKEEMHEDEMFILGWLFPFFKKYQKDILIKWKKINTTNQMKMIVKEWILWIIHYFQFYMICSEFFYTDSNLFCEEVEIIYHPEKMKKYLFKISRDSKKQKSSFPLHRFSFLHNQILELEQKYHKIFSETIHLFSLSQDIKPILFSQFAFQNISFYQNQIKTITQKKKKWFLSLQCMSNLTE